MCKSILDKEYINSEIKYNQDSTCFTVSTDNGYSVYSTNPFSICHKVENGEKTTHLSMLYCTSLVVASGDESNSIFKSNVLHIYNTKKNSTICELTFGEPIINIELNRKYIMISLKSVIHVYNISTMSELVQLNCFRTNSGLLSTMSTSDSPILAITSPHSLRKIRLYNLDTNETLREVEAHDSFLSAIKLSPSGKYLASASKKGSLIRVFAVDSGELIYTFRRGFIRCDIKYLEFDESEKYLTVSSNRKTVHIFNLIPENRYSPGCCGIGFLGYWCQSVRSNIKVESDPGYSKSSTLISSKNQLIVTSTKGNYFIYMVDLNQRTANLKKKLEFKDAQLSEGSSETSHGSKHSTSGEIQVV